jgi:hypothetical protein
VLLTRLRPKRALEEFAHRHGARELVFAIDGSNPPQVRGERLRPEDLGNRVRIEEKRHEDLVRCRRVATSDAGRGLKELHQLVGSLPPASHAGQAPFRSSCTKTLEHLNVLRRDKCRNDFSMAGDEYGVPAFGSSNLLRERGFDLGDGKLSLGHGNDLR